MRRSGLVVDRHRLQCQACRGEAGLRAAVAWLFQPDGIADIGEQARDQLEALLRAWVIRICSGWQRTERDNRR